MNLIKHAAVEIVAEVQRLGFSGLSLQFTQGILIKVKEGTYAIPNPEVPYEGAGGDSPGFGYTSELVEKLEEMEDKYEEPIAEVLKDANLTMPTRKGRRK